jgi:hypothetical protein
MAARPSQVIERLVGLLIPPASREEVLGDLHERCETTPRFLVEAAFVIPHVIASRIRRTTDRVILLMQALTLYTSFVLAALWLDRPLLYDESGYALLAIPGAIVLVVVIFADAYADPKKLSPLRPMLAPVLGMAFAFALPALPRAVMIAGGSIGILLLSTLRFIFPPLADRAQIARVPAHWQKLELVPLPFPGGRWLVVALLLWFVVSHWLRAK